MKSVPNGSAARSFLPVLIAVPLALAAGYAARSQVQTAPPAATHVQPEKPAAVAPRPPARVPLPPAPAGPIEPRGETAAAAPPASTQSAPLPAPPPAALERAGELRQWLLDLPSTDIARLSGTSEMDAYVGRIVGELQAASGGNPDAGQDIEKFLTQINAAIVRAKSER